MDEEAAFLRAIQANPSDATAKLVYADWLDERCERDKADYLRAVAERRSETREQFQFNRRLRVWLELVNGRAVVWDAPTMYALGRLRGLLDAYANLSGHQSDISYEFDARLHTGSIGELVASHFGPDCAPVNIEDLPDWETGLRTVLNEWLFMELGQLRNGPHHRLGFLTEDGCGWLIDDVINHVRGVINPTIGWRIQVTPQRFYALNWADVALEAAGRVLFLHFSFSD